MFQWKGTLMELVTRRNFVRTSVAAGAVVATVTAAGIASQGAAGELRKVKNVKIIGISCSPRKGKTTAASLQVCLEAAKKVSPRIEVELVELAGMKIDGSLAAGLPLEPGQKDDFAKLVPKLADPDVGGIIIGTPVYFSGMASLCKAFLDRCITLWQDNLKLSNKVAGVLAVGGSRNGGQEVTIQSVQAVLLCQEMIVVGTSGPAPRIGATVWNSAGYDVSKDEFGMTKARDLGRRVAEVALRVKGV
jgi:multimeric flavodoxin WrbA